MKTDAHFVECVPGPLILGSDCLARLLQTTSAQGLVDGCGQSSTSTSTSTYSTLLIIYRIIALSRDAPRWQGRYWVSLWRRILYSTLEKVHGESANLTRFNTNLEEIGSGSFVVLEQKITHPIAEIVQYGDS